MIALLSYVLGGFRLWLCIPLLNSGTVSGFILGVVGLIAVATTVWAWAIGKPDLTWSGLSVGVGHLAILLFSASGPHVHQVAPVFWFLFAVQCWVKWHLGRRCTVTGPVWVDVIQSGPYSWIRHPMTFIELLMAGVFFFEFPSVRNGVVFLIVLASKFAITLFEERFLKLQPSYRDYCLRVPWRFWPGVW
ncbi:MAG: hypothetical protein M9920_15510 [Verrucomicrobiae bacterium]|nr:hypothetical protein [Verrucomicrobiae bacterium]